MKISVIIPVFNEATVIRNCLHSLDGEKDADFEVIVVDDGSSDNSVNQISSFRPQKYSLHLYKQKHLGPGAARNLGAEKAKGEILVFVDADMEFAPDFLEKLSAPIIEGNLIGTFSKEEYLLNQTSNLARDWNLNLGRRPNQMVPDKYPDQAPVFRAILKKEFVRAGGFDTKIGYTDDWSISRKLGSQSRVAPGAIYYHRNPETLSEVWVQARWFGKNEFLTKNLIRKIYNLIRYNPIFAIVKGVVSATRLHQPEYLAFKITYDTAVFTSVLLSFFHEQKAK